MSDRARYEQALIAADKAGDTVAAQKLARALRSMPQESQAPQTPEPSSSAQEPADNRPTGDALDAVLEPATYGSTRVASTKKAVQNCPKPSTPCSVGMRTPLFA